MITLHDHGCDHDRYLLRNGVTFIVIYIDSNLSPKDLAQVSWLISGTLVCRRSRPFAPCSERLRGALNHRMSWVKVREGATLPWRNINWRWHCRTIIGEPFAAVVT